MRVDRSIAAAAGSVAIAVAVVTGYLAYLGRYATSGVYWDEWNWVELMSKSYQGSLTLGDLWRQHNEHRIFFPNVIALLLGRATGFSEIGFIYLGAAFLIAAVLVLIVACRGDLLRHPLAYLPAIFIFFSLAQYENTLWGFQFSWFLIVACIAGALTLLTAPRLGPWRFFAAVAVGIIASYSSLQGLTIWAAGLLALMRPGISLKMRIAWCGAGAVVTAFYVHDLRPGALGISPISELPDRARTAIDGFFVAVGSVVPDLTFVTRSGPDLSFTAFFGVIITIAGCVVVVSWIIHGRSDRLLTIAAALVVVGLLFDLMLTPGRLSLGAITGTVSRYTTFNLLLLGGAYLGAVRTFLCAFDSRSTRRIPIRGAFAGVMVGLVCIQVPVATGAGVLGGITTHTNHAEAANLTANYAIAPRSLVAMFGYPPSYAYFESQAAFLEAYGLNVFGDGESAGYQRSGVVEGGMVTSPLPVPGELGPIRSSSAQWQAWLALSSVYEQRPDLQKAFPGPTVRASRHMVAWALQFGLDSAADPVAAAVLRPYADQYRTWLAEETDAP
jgi:hypothetical protein